MTTTDREAERQRNRAIDPDLTEFVDGCRERFNASLDAFRVHERTETE